MGQFSKTRTLISGQYAFAVHAGKARLDGGPDLGNGSSNVYGQVSLLLLKRRFAAQPSFADHIRVWLRRELIQCGGIDRLQLS
jgi:hypothetical protein